MGAQEVSIIGGVISTAIAALGLLLAWYRHDERKGKSGGGYARDRQKARARIRLRIAVIAGIGVVSLAAVGVLFTVRSDRSGQSSSSVGAQRSGAMLTRRQYQDRVSQLCLDAQEKARRLEELNAQETLFGPAIKVEEDEVDGIKALVPPREFRSTHNEMIAVWDRRVSLLEATYRRLAQLTDDELAAQLAITDAMAEELARSFRSLGIPECVM
jgi:hypothetical protein